ncbi:MAG TPA: ABC transporter permease [Streptosporangiaceae bacterium]|nr:ABC transporter permease [Streptosporangiaceae bacterium]
MTAWLARRLAQMIIVVFGVVTLAFLLAYIVPGDPARLVAGPNASPQAVASIARQLGLDNSLWSQYVTFLGRLLHGNLGTSFALQGRSVSSEIGRALPVTVALAIGGVLWEIVLGIPIGILAAYRPRGILDRFSTLGALVGLSAPPFWLGLMLLYFLAYKLSLFPLSGTGSPFVWYLILPSFTLGVGGAAWYSRMVRTTMLAVLRSPYIEFARLKGMPERTILLRHALRHVLTPVITMLGMDLGYFLGGVLIIESVFGLPGVGQLAYNAIGTLDIPMITGTVLLAALFMVVMSFVVDVTYTVVDPRVRLSRR